MGVIYRAQGRAARGVTSAVKVRVGRVSEQSGHVRMLFRREALRRLGIESSKCVPFMMWRFCGPGRLCYGDYWKPDAT